MKEKLLSALKTKYKNLGLSDKVLEGVAETLATTTTDEANIETAVAGVESLLKSFQSDVDSRVTSAVERVKKEIKPEPPKKDNGGAEPKPKADDDTPEWAKSLLQEVTTLKQQVQNTQLERTSVSRKQLLEDKLKDANPVFKAHTLKAFERMQFETDDEFNSYVEEVAKDAGELSKESLGALGRPLHAGGSNAEPSKEEIKAIVNELV